MSLDRSQVENVARLARIKIDENEMADYVDSLSSILALVDQMHSHNTHPHTRSCGMPKAGPPATPAWAR